MKHFILFLIALNLVGCALTPTQRCRGEKELNFKHVNPFEDVSTKYSSFDECVKGETEADAKESEARKRFATEIGESLSNSRSKNDRRSVEIPASPKRAVCNSKRKSNGSIETECKEENY